MKRIGNLKLCSNLAKHVIKSSQKISETVRLFRQQWDQSLSEVTIATSERLQSHYVGGGY